MLPLPELLSWKICLTLYLGLRCLLDEQTQYTETEPQYENLVLLNHHTAIKLNKTALHKKNHTHVPIKTHLWPQIIHR